MYCSTLRSIPAVASLAAAGLVRQLSRAPALGFGRTVEEQMSSYATPAARTTESNDLDLMAWSEGRCLCRRQFEHEVRHDCEQVLASV